MMLQWLAFLAIALLLSSLRLLSILRPSPPRSKPIAAPSTILVFLGSGGHTAEMFRLLSALDFTRYKNRRYLYSVTDTFSQAKALEFERNKAGIFSVSAVRRAREVHQSWLSTPWSTVLCFVDCLCALFLPSLPDAILCNGPGSCVTLVLAAYVPKFLGIKHIRVIYVESFARVSTLSLSGRLLLPLVDRFLVQWPALAQKYPRAEYLGVLV